MKRFRLIVLLSGVAAGGAGLGLLALPQSVTADEDSCTERKRCSSATWTDCTHSPQDVCIFTGGYPLCSTDDECPPE